MTASGGAGGNSAGVGLVVEFPLPRAASGPDQIVAGPDGALWFTEQQGGKIGRITVEGAITEFAAPATATGGLTPGPDGNLWFTEPEVGVGAVGQITPTGVVKEFPVRDRINRPFRIAAGADGNLWFSEQGSGKIGRISTSGGITEFEAAVTFGEANGITGGPDGNIWYTNLVRGAVVRMTTSGMILNEFFGPPSDALLQMITAGKDGKLWVTSNEKMSSSVWSVTAEGTFTRYQVTEADARLGAIEGDATGRLWFVVPGTNQLGVLMPGMPISFYDVPTADSYPLGIAVGPDGAIWFTEFAGNKIGRLRPSFGTVATTPGDIVTESQ